MEVAKLLPYFGILILIQTMISTSGHIYILLGKEKVFMYVGIVNAIITIAAIIIGSLYSVKHIAIAYTASYLLIIVPIILYVGFIKTFNFSWAFIRNFWIPKIFLAVSILVFVLLDLKVWLIVFMLLYLLHLLIYQRKDIYKLSSIVKNKMENN